jgi:hypothetical protein
MQVDVKAASPLKGNISRIDSVDSAHTSTEAELSSPDGQTQDKALTMLDDYSILDNDANAASGSHETIKVICRFRPEKKVKAPSHGTPHSSHKSARDTHNQAPQLTSADVFNIFGDSKIVEVTNDRKTVNDNLERRKYAFDKVSHRYIALLK